MVKVYGIAGRTCADITIRAGKATLQIEFTKGCLDRKNYRPATYSTGDPVIQMMIENSPLFGNLIRIHRIYGGESPKASEETAYASAERDTPVLQSFPDVTDFEGVVETLKSLGAKATNLKTVDGIRKFMVAKNIEFPNYEFEQ